MNRYHKYHIKGTDSFNPGDFPKVQAELDDMFKAARNVTARHTEKIIISYLKDHSLEKEWIKENPELTRLLRDGHFITAEMEALFHSCTTNKSFSQGFEDHIRETLAGCSMQNAEQRD